MENKTESVHKTVLLNETIEGLNLPDKKSKPDTVVLDATFGGGGHTLLLAERFPHVKIIAIDQDKGAWKKAESKFKGIGAKISFHNANFRDIDAVLKKEGLEELDGIIMDLGLSSDQLENSGRGFSFMKDEPLLMTMKENPSREDLTAKDIVNTWAEQSLADIIYGYGEEKLARRIARAIVEARAKKHFETTLELVDVIGKSVPAGYKRGRIHFATRTFQALRIATNDELQTLTVGLQKGFELLAPRRRMAVISFHSLEDRITKRFFKAKEVEMKAKLITKKPITPKEEELKENPRARSAKLRIIEKIL